MGLILSKSSLSLHSISEFIKPPHSPTRKPCLFLPPPPVHPFMILVYLLLPIFTMALPGQSYSHLHRLPIWPPCLRLPPSRFLSFPFPKLKPSYILWIGIWLFLSCTFFFFFLISFLLSVGKVQLLTHGLWSLEWLNSPSIPRKRE